MQLKTDTVILTCLFSDEYKSLKKQQANQFIAYLPLFLSDTLLACISMSVHSDLS